MRSRTREARTASCTGGRAPYHDETGVVTAIVSGGLDITMRRQRERSSNASETSRRRSSRRCRASWSRSRATARSATATSTTRPSARTAPSRRRSGGRTTSSSGDSSSTSSSRTTTDAQRTRSQPRPPARPPSPWSRSSDRADGTSRAFAWSAIPVADVTDRLEGLVLVTGMDITERLRLEDEKERERAFLNAIANTAPSLLCLIDDKGVMTERGANIAFEETLEYDPAEIGGQVFWEAFVDPEESDEVRDAIMRVAAGEPPAERDNTWLTKTRPPRSRWRGRARRSPSMDERTLFLVTGLDITERKRVAEELRASRAAARARRGRGAARARAKPPRRRAAAARRALGLAPARSSRGSASDREAALELLAGAQTELAQALEELRELARGIHPAVLTDRGLAACARDARGTHAGARSSSIAPDERLAPAVEAAAYYVVAESLTNVAKYARATSAAVSRPAAGRRAGRDGLRRRRRRRRSRARIRSPRARRPRGRSRRDALDREPPGGGTSIRAEIPLVERDRPKPIHSRREQPADRNRHVPLRRRREDRRRSSRTAGRLRRGRSAHPPRLLRDAVAAARGARDRRGRRRVVAAFADGRRRRRSRRSRRSARCRDAEWPSGTARSRAHRAPHRDADRSSDEGYTGVDVVRASRIAYAGHGGQIVALGDDAARSSTAFATRDLGEHRLEGLTRPERHPPAPGRRPSARLSSASQHGRDAREPGSRVVLADDTVLLREGVARLLEEAGFDVVAPVGTTPTTCCATSRCTSPTSRSSTSACRRRTRTKACGPRAEIRRALLRTRASSCSRSTWRPATRSTCSRRAPRASAICSRIASPTSSEFASAVRRVAEGGSALDSGRRQPSSSAGAAQDDPLDEPDPARARGARADGRGPLEPGDRGAAVRHAPRRREARHEHLHEARPPGEHGRPPARARRADVSQRLRAEGEVSLAPTSPRRSRSSVLARLGIERSPTTPAAPRCSWSTCCYRARAPRGRRASRACAPPARRCRARRDRRRRGRRARESRCSAASRSRRSSAWAREADGERADRALLADAVEDDDTPRAPPGDEARERVDELALRSANAPACSRL